LELPKTITCVAQH